MAAFSVGCSETPAEVSAKADDEASVVQESPGDESADDGSSEVSSDTTADASGDEAEAGEVTDENAGTASLGDTVEVGDWSVKVTEVAKNANEAIRKANPFNEKPKGVYVLVTYEATYNGGERTADVGSDLSWSLTTTDNRVLDQAYQVTPADDKEWSTEARKGGTLKQQVLFDVKPKLLSGGILSVEGYDENFDSVFADFIVE